MYTKFAMQFIFRTITVLVTNTLRGFHKVVRDGHELLSNSTCEDRSVLKQNKVYNSYMRLPFNTGWRADCDATD